MIVVVVVVLSPILRLWDWDYRWNVHRGGLSKGSEHVFTRVSEITSENSERLGRQARSGNELDTSHLKVFSAEPGIIK